MRQRTGSKTDQLVSERILAESNAPTGLEPGRGVVVSAVVDGVSSRHRSSFPFILPAVALPASGSSGSGRLRKWSPPYLLDLPFRRLRGGGQPGQGREEARALSQEEARLRQEL